MRKLQFILILIALSPIHAFSQTATNSEWKEGFMTGCMKKNPDLKGVNQEGFCNCAYDKIVNELPEDKLAKIMIAGLKEDEEDLGEMILNDPEIMELITSCMSDNYITESGIQLDEDDADELMWDVAKVAYMDECKKGIKKDKSLRKQVDADEFCTCTWNKVRQEISWDEMVNNDDESQEKITDIAMKCMLELMK